MSLQSSLLSNCPLKYSSCGDFISPFRAAAVENMLGSAVWSSSGNKNLPSELAVSSNKAMNIYLSLLSFSHSTFPVKSVTTWCYLKYAQSSYTTPKSLFGYFWAFFTSLWFFLTQTILCFCYSDSVILWFYDQSLRKETEIFSWYFPSSCHLDVSHLSFLLFCAFMYVPLFPLNLRGFFLILVFSFSSTRNTESRLWNCRVLYHFMSLYQAKYNHTNHFKSNKFSICEISLDCDLSSFHLYRKMRSKNKISFRGKPPVPGYLF